MFAPKKPVSPMLAKRHELKPKQYQWSVLNLRLVILTESIWPKFFFMTKNLLEYDQKNSHRQILMFWTWPKYGWIWPKKYLFDKLAHVQVVINCPYSTAHLWTSEGVLAHNLGALPFDDIMSYNSWQLNVLRCEFFGLVHPIRSYSFSHLESVMLTFLLNLT